jgi:hypothetical protein
MKIGAAAHGWGLEIADVRPGEESTGGLNQSGRKPIRRHATGRSRYWLAGAGLGVTVRGPAQDIAGQIAAIPDVTYVLTGTGRFDVIAAADTSSETSLLRTIEHIRALRGVKRVQRAGGTRRSSRKLPADNIAGPPAERTLGVTGPPAAFVSYRSDARHCRAWRARR